MPIIKSAIKRVRQSETRRKRNLIRKDFYKASIKQFLKLVDEGNKKEAAELFPTVQKSISMAAKNNLMHKNTAGRKTSRLAKMIAGTEVKAAAKPVAKKATAPKKAVAKKPAAKKTA